MGRSGDCARGEQGEQSGPPSAEEVVRREIEALEQQAKLLQARLEALSQQANRPSCAAVAKLGDLRCERRGSTSQSSDSDDLECFSSSFSRMSTEEGNLEGVGFSRQSSGESCTWEAASQNSGRGLGSTPTEKEEGSLGTLSAHLLSLGEASGMRLVVRNTFIVASFAASVGTSRRTASAPPLNRPRR
jgi:hypothetical protein